jgi:phosphatidylserine decarboxylase
MSIPAIISKCLPPRPSASQCLGLLPHHFLSACMFEATRCRFAPWKNRQISWFVERYQVNLNEAEQQNPEQYSDFNAFFTRALAANARTIHFNDEHLVCPADGQLSEYGQINSGQLFQAKGKEYSLSALLAGDQVLAEQFNQGQYLTVYLSPRDYHRVHMPATGKLRQMLHVPGRLFSVNTKSSASVNDLFARNERVISVFDTPLGSMAIILVGAMFVGSIEHTWAGQVSPGKDGDIKRITYSGESAMEISQGAEMGRFNMGSTVIILMENRELEWSDGLNVGQDLRLGQVLTGT